MVLSSISDSPHFINYPLAELHAHIGTSIHPFVYWQIAHRQGYKLPQKTYQAFRDEIMLSKDNKMLLDEYLKKIYHPILDKLSTGNIALEQAMYETLGEAYRNNITHIEIRGNVMKHNKNGEHDLDHVIMAMLHGMERAFLEYPGLSGGYIFCLDRDFSIEKNTILLDKAIKYRKRGVVGIDIAGPAVTTFHIKDYKDIYMRAKKAGLHRTVHSGEVENANDMWEALEYLDPERIGHGIKAAYNKALMKELAKRKIVLEICPMSNIMTKAVENEEELQFIIKTFLENNVLFTINTDWPETIKNGHLWEQYDMLLKKKIMTEEELMHCNQIAFEHTFAPKGGLDAYL